jgi:hypothetical protein
MLKLLLLLLAWCPTAVNGLPHQLQLLAAMQELLIEPGYEL